MEQRINIKKIQPEAYTAMRALEEYGATTKVDPVHKELIKIRASQINGCAFCIDMHTKDARKMGETEQRIYLLNAWRESPQFSEQEKTILAMTEEITLITRKGLTRETYEQAIKHFGEEVTAQVIIAIIAINGWNRMCVSTHVIPGAL